MVGGVSSATPPPIVPTPERIEVLDGAMERTNGSRIVCVTGGEMAISELIRGEIEQLFGLGLDVARVVSGRAGDIILKLGDSSQARCR